MLRKAINALFATARVKDFQVEYDKHNAKTFIETRMPDGIIRRHRLDITLSTFLTPSEGLKNVVIWKALKKFMDQQPEYGKLAYIQYNGVLFSVD